MHNVEVVRRDGRYRVICEECGEVASSQTQKAVMLDRASRHASTGLSDGRSAAVIEKLASRPVREKAAADEDEKAPATTHRVKGLTATDADRQNKCMYCLGPLRARDGHFHTTRFPMSVVCCEHVVCSLKEISS